MTHDQKFIIMITQSNFTVPSKKELLLIAQGICSSNKRTLHLLESVLPKLVAGYSHVYQKQKRDFFGLRDFYSLVKMIYQTACDIEATPGPEEIALCVQVSPTGFNTGNGNILLAVSFKNHYNISL